MTLFALTFPCNLHLWVEMPQTAYSLTLDMQNRQFSSFDGHRPPQTLLVNQFAVCFTHVITIVHF